MKNDAYNHETMNHNVDEVETIPNEHTDDDQLLSTLISMFPNKPIEILRNSLKSADNDIELAISILLSGNNANASASASASANANANAKDNTKSISEGEQKLQTYLDMFPTIAKSFIKSAYKRYHNSKPHISDDELITELLNFELLSSEDAKAQKIIQNQIKLKKNDTTMNMKIGKKNPWNSVSDNIQTIIQFTMVSRDVASRYLFHNQMNPVLAIIDIIFNYTNTTIEKNQNLHQKVEGKEAPATISSTFIRNKANYGRVQSNNGFAHLSTKTQQQRSKSNSSRTIPEKKISNEEVILSTFVPSQETGKPFRYSANDPNVIELNSIINDDSNLPLKSINPLFYKNCLRFFNGDINKIIPLALFIIKDNLANATFIHNLGTKENNVNPNDDTSNYKFIEVTSSSSKRKATKKHKSTSRSNSADNLSISTPLQQPNNFKDYQREGLQMISNLFETYTLDFHGFQSSDAINILKLGLNKWWSKELLEREINSKKYSITKSNKVIYLKPLTLITGRGLHSVGGVPRIKIQVKKYLNQNNFVYWEEPSFFIVEGKRQK
ncbi:Cue2p NDAI_0K02080 [Naumovozyma dairenensis CBS 421]|uniref:Smr domain-containing protein n=1 Tax=Naumovozyma dairenensis (strain ATCC 10597 / BCRC 20456 / CBS 421 / NBRC 0211 / NRRL Y-12639) TaxID=1071378 RepID=G0WHY8_NAUDC|nr:hypothetical protein NDAI_0K02080 [Naumovozyma dairenensis CBS 421]CCD27399.1 hypothetical protein NDAI_0K02080 [Naumovozyma dairenensis CBS 421]